MKENFFIYIIAILVILFFITLFVYSTVEGLRITTSQMKGHGLIEFK